MIATIGKVNMCTATIYVAPEVEKRKDLKVEYECRKGGYPVRACKYFKPMTCAGGLHCYNECEYLENGCTNKRARKECMKRTCTIVEKMLKAVKSRTEQAKK